MDEALEPEGKGEQEIPGPEPDGADLNEDLPKDNPSGNGASEPFQPGETRLVLAQTGALIAGLVAVGLALAWLTGHPRAWHGQGALGPDALDITKDITRIVVGSGADQTKPQPVWSMIAAQKPDLVLLMGDNVRGSGARDDPEMKDLAAAYQAFGRVPEFQAVRKTTPILATWDDHDFGPTDSGGDFLFKAKSKELFEAFWHIDTQSARAKRPGLYDAVITGSPGHRVQIIFLDTRWFRDPLKPTDYPGAPGRERYLPDLDPKHTLLGEAQWSWLEGELKKEAELRLIVSSIQVVADEHGWEKWGNFPNERMKLFDLIAKTGAKGVIFLSGDRHLGAIYRLANEEVPYPIFEITASGLNSVALNKSVEPGPHRLGPVYEGENFGLVTIDWMRHAVVLELKGLDGQTVRLASVPLAVLVPGTLTPPSVLWPGWSEPDPAPAPQSSVDPASVDPVSIGPEAVGVSVTPVIAPASSERPAGAPSAAAAAAPAAQPAP